jgi:PAS domain S-box-containing protein
MDTLFLNEHRCQCGKLLLKGVFFDGALEIKCKKCGEINKIGIIKLADDSTHYLLIINDKGKIVNVSDSACRILGYTHEELIGKYFTQINPTLSPEIGKKLFGPESVLNEDNHLKLDTFYQTKEGKKFPVTVLLRLYKTNDKEKFILLASEIRSSQDDNQTADENTKNFVDSACDFYFDVDKDGIGEYVSPSVETLFGFTPDLVIGKNYFDFTPLETREEFRRRFQQYAAKALPFKIENKAGLNSKRKMINNELYFTPKFNDAGKFTGYRVLGWVIKNPL